MTRLSDSLRGLANRAPIDDATVSVAGAAKRIQRGKRMRAAANATAGAGVAAVVALAAINPGGAGITNTAKDRPELAAADAAGGGAPSVAGFGGDATRLAWGLCGSRPFDGDVPNASTLFSLELGEVGDEVTPGSTVTPSLTTVWPSDASDYASEPASLMVLWDGYVVGTAQAASDAADDAAGTSTTAVDLPLVNCWDGGELPPGAYEVVAARGFYATAVAEPSGPTEPSDPTEPSVDPVKPTVMPTEPVVPPAEVGTADAPGTVSEDVIEPDPSGEAGTATGGANGNTGVVGPAADGSYERAVSNHVKLLITGDVPDDPFGQYLGGGSTPAPSYPDDYLYPDIARGEYAAHVTTEPWDMAPGTQRVIIASDAATQDQFGANQYFGCSWDGQTGISFPAESSTWEPLDVTTNAPHQVDLRYGWVVDNNPEVRLSATNTSGYTVPGFWGEPNAALMLVKGNRVVAESYLSSTNRNGNQYVGDGMLAPGASVTGTFLWRDVAGCWDGNTQPAVEPGTYTMLQVQSLYVDNGYGAGGGIVEPYYDDAASSTLGGTARTEDAAGSLIAPAPGPAPDQGSYDYVELQVWTSLGTVTVR